MPRHSSGHSCNFKQATASCEGKQLIEDIPLSEQLQCSKTVASSLAKKCKLLKSAYETLDVKQSGQVFTFLNHIVLQTVSGLVVHNTTNIYAADCYRGWSALPILDVKNTCPFLLHVQQPSVQSDTGYAKHR
jgi:hypothetical protein